MTTCNECETVAHCLKRGCIPKVRSMIDMAREAGFPMAWISDNDGGVIRWKDIKAFEALVRADEREACAKVAQETICDTHIPTNVNIYGTRAAKAIRERGQA